jgi:hypothetical protein
VLLDLSPGLGGGMVLLAEKYRCYVDGFELSQDLLDGAKDGPLSKGIERWQVTQLNPVHLWSRQLYDDNLDSMKLDVRAREDISEVFRDYILIGFRVLVEELQSTDAKPHRTDLMAMMMEAERWARCVALLESGELQVMRFFALKSIQIAMDEPSSVG